MSEQRLEGLLAREAIRDLPLRYCDCVWRNDIDGIVDLFSTDGSFITIYQGKETAVTGHNALREFYVGGLDLQPRPYIHNHVIDLAADGKSASGRCYLDLRSAKNNMAWLGAGFYEDNYVADGDAWRFKSRRFNALHMEEVPDGMK